MVEPSKSDAETKEAVAYDFGYFLWEKYKMGLKEARKELEDFNRYYGLGLDRRALDRIAEETARPLRSGMERELVKRYGVPILGRYSEQWEKVLKELGMLD